MRMAAYGISAMMCLSGTALAQAPKPATLAPIGAVGVFTVGGTIIDTKNVVSMVPGPSTGKALVGQSFVQYFLPQGETDKPPIVMVPGLGLAASMYLMGPPGGESWAGFFLRHGYPVYLFQRPGEGPSGFDPGDLNAAIRGDTVEGLTPIPRSSGLAGAGVTSRLGAGDIYPDAQFPKDEDFKIQAFSIALAQPNAGPIDAGYAGALTLKIPPWEIGPSTQGYDGGGKGLVALLEKIGPAIIIAHSLGGPVSMNSAAARPDLVRQLVMVEPAGCPAIGDKIAKIPFMHVEGDRPKGYASENAPIVANSQKFYLQCDALVESAKANGTRGRALYLKDIGQHGNSHLLMVETNNIAIASEMLNFIEAK